MEVNLKELKEIAKRFDLSLVIAFGSQVTGKFKLDGDLDIAVLFDSSRRQITTELGSALLEALARIFPAYRLDLVILNFADPLLKFRVSQEGMVLYQKGEHLFQRFRLSSIKQHIDSAKFYKMEREFLKRYVKEIEDGSR